MRKIGFISLFLFLSVSGIVVPALAQQETGPRRGSRVVDDTTKQIYGPKTSRYFYEEDVFFNKNTFHYIDTLIRNFHRFAYIQQTEYKYQDLGNIGTAARPVYYQAPAYIGVSTGFEQFDLYWEGDKIRYFDTRSPYSNMKVAIGKRGRSITNVTFSRNINPRWNFGFDYRGMFVDKQIQRKGKGDRNIRSTYYDAFSTYYNKDSTYRVFVNFARHMYQADEFGGVRTFRMDSIFEVNARPLLQEAESRELRTRFHLFHQVEVGKALQVYHTMDRSRQGNQFIDVPGRETHKFDYTIVPLDTTRDRTTLRTFRNEAGIKGNISKVFYNGYYAIRHYSMRYKYFSMDSLNSLYASDTLSTPFLADEHYLGGRIALQLDSLGELRGWIERIDNGNYRLEGKLVTRWIEATAKQNQYSVPFLHQLYLGTHDLWKNNFKNTQVTQLNGYVHYRSKVLHVSPGLTFTRLKNYTYFTYDSVDNQTQRVLPRQSANEQIIFLPEVKFSATFLRHIFLRGNVIYTTVNDKDSAIQVPKVFVNAQLAYENIFYHGNLDMHAGVDVHWHSAYYAPSYDPVIQQFYIRTKYKVPAFPIVDIFLNAKVKRGRIFFKWHNFMQVFLKNGDLKRGYSPTPFFPGQINSIDFGFDWSFYD